MLLQELTDLVGKAFEAQGLDKALGRVTVADRPDLADMQCNGALQAAKAAGKKPRDVAEAVVAALRDKTDIFAEISIAGPGFINFKLAPGFLAQKLAAQNAHKKFGVADPEKALTYLIEYISPNMGKALHIGHLRNAMIGDATRRMVAFMGHKVITDNHLGDWGLPMGQILNETYFRHPDLPHFDETRTDYPADAPITFEELCDIYPAGSQKCKDSPEELAKAQEFTAKLQSGNYPGLTALWRYFMELSLVDMNEKLDMFGVPRYDTYYGESYFQQFIPMVLADMEKKGVLVDVDGAKGVPVQEESDKYDIPPLIIEKKMGGVTYSATDIATFYQRKKDFDPDVMIVVTDFRQELHFLRAYRAARKAGYTKDTMQFVHLMYGTINDKQGKPYKTRNGATPGFTYLIDLADAKAQERMKEIGLDQKLSPEELAETGKQIGLASIKFGDLINYRRSDYIFDLDKFVSFEGKTGPYLQYAVVRLNALLAKASAQNYVAGDFQIDAAQHDVALLLLQFPHAVENALADYAPNVLADYLFRLGQAVNSFYQNVHVLTEQDPARRASALALLGLSARILTQGLDLLGIKIPAQM